MNFILRTHMHMRGVSEFMETSPEIMKWGFDFVLIKPTLCYTILNFVISTLFNLICILTRLDIIQLIRVHR